MAIRVQCACGKTFETPEANAGKTGRCPQCGSPLQVPTRATSSGRSPGQAPKRASERSARQSSGRHTAHGDKPSSRSDSAVSGLKAAGELVQTKLKISQLGTRLRALTLEVGELACLAGRSLGADLEEEIRVAESAVEVARSELRLREAELARTSADGVEKVKVGQRVQAARTKVAAAEQALLLTKQKAYEQLGQQVLAGGTPIDGCDSQIEEFARVRDELRALESASAELGSRVKNNKPALFLLGSVAILCLCLFTCFLSAVANGPRAGAGATCAELESQMRQFYRDSPSVPGYHWGIDERAWLGQFGSPDAARGAGLLEFAWWMYACSDGELWVQIQEKVRRERGALLVLKYEARHK